jgi:hypothetical protein
MNQSSSNHGIRFTVRGLLAVIAFFAVAFASLKFANEIWLAILSSVALLLLMAIAIVAFVGLGAMRAFAIGYALCVVIYGGAVYVSEKDEFDPARGGLPTTLMLRPVFTGPVQHTYTDMSGKPMPRNYVPPQNSRRRTGFMSGGTIVLTAEHPSREVFMTIGHLLWAVILGFIGGQFAGFVYARGERQAELADRAAEHS